MIPVQNVSLGQNAHRSFTAIETIHNSTVQAVNCREYHTAHSVAQHINNWCSFLLFATCFESYRSYAETILTSNPFSSQYMNSKCRGYELQRVENLQFHTDIFCSEDARRYKHGPVERVKVTRILHWRWRHDCRTIITLVGGEKRRQLSRANEWYNHYIWWGGNDTISLTLSHDCTAMPSRVEGCH